MSTEVVLAMTPPENFTVAPLTTAPVEVFTVPEMRPLVASLIVAEVVLPPTTVTVVEFARQPDLVAEIEYVAAGTFAKLKAPAVFVTTDVPFKVTVAPERAWPSIALTTVPFTLPP